MDHLLTHFRLHLSIRPTARDFTYIISFLFRQVDPHFKMIGKLEEEVIGFFKVITPVPFSPSKRFQSYTRQST
jgi:SMC interacting uncharacterized protein involved in chromosome segregation